MSATVACAPGGTSEQDRASLDSLCLAMTERGSFRYVEVGCYMGESLRRFLADPRCESVLAIDRRDEVSPDARGSVTYAQNTTAAMLQILEQVPGLDLDKLTTLDGSTNDLDPAEYEADFCFVDAEHTDEAVLRDARFCRAVVRDRGLIVFHDRTLVARGLQRFLAELPGRTRIYPMRNELLIVELGIPTLLSDRRVRAQIPRRSWLLAAGLRAVPLMLKLSSLRSAGA